MKCWKERWVVLKPHLKQKKKTDTSFFIFFLVFVSQAQEKYFFPLQASDQWLSGHDGLSVLQQTSWRNKIWI